MAASAMIDIYFEELVESKKKDLLELVGAEDPSEMNWDIFPLFTLEFEEED